MKTLTLSLKKQWFDMIKSGEKKEEYREIKYHWLTRFFRVKDVQRFYGVSDMTPLLNGIARETFAREYGRLVFTLGYPKADDTSRRLEFKNPKIRIGEGCPEWGAEPGKLYFVISWGE